MPLDRGQIPDTVMLEDRAALLINSMVGCVDEDTHNIPFFHADFVSKPAYLQHSPWDYGQQVGRFIEGILLARHMSGSTQGEDIEQKWKDLLFEFFHEDGLSYRWKSPYSQDYANFHDQTHVLSALTVWYMLTGEPRAKTAGDKMCAMMKKISSKDRDFWYLPAVEYTPDGWPLLDALYMRTASDPAHINGRMINQLTKYYQVTGNYDALQLAENYAAQVVKYSAAYNPDGSFNDKMEFRNGHFHSRMITLASVAKYAAFAGNSSYLGWVQKIYDWALSRCTTFGWTPGGMDKNKAYLHETCTLVDFIETGIILALNGYPEYWHTVDRFVRNHLVESQLLDTGWIEEHQDKSMDIVGQRTYNKVATRLKGAFAGYAAPNDYVSEFGHLGRHQSDMQACCLGSGSRGLFLPWSNIVTEKFGRVSVNLLFNRSSRWLDVSSYLPHEGKVELNIHQDIPQLLVRTPDWTPLYRTTITRQRGGEASEEMATAWVEQHVDVGPCLAGDRITVAFPLRQVETKETAVDQEFRGQWRGDDVIDINPRGQHYPFYSNRRVFDQAPMRANTLRRLDKELYW